MSGQFQRLADQDRQPVDLTIDGTAIQALEGDTLLTAILLHRDHLRQSEFGDGARGGFCLMGACQDCWVSAADGSRLRACTTYVVQGMSIVTAPEAGA
ncbi:(2Fe-2S)-binding protein [Dongia soli]|uniref:(2Fe-2S)-binding protein n=1 Tax=Dongia soli TaxID=600628 RepID=A0ABU5EFQ5_9PROT|nr:(2Fe-2S)-binding protein [Dongia soli]MDY0885027.1 (2Fe-2S)-binding protein [Dongia soli]